MDWKFEFDAAELLAEDEDKLTDRVIRKLDRGLLTINEALTELGQDIIEDDAVGDLRMVDSRLVPLESLIGGGGLPETGLEGAEQEVLKAIRTHEEHLQERIEEAVRLALEARDGA